MSKALFIAEKPSVAREFAKALHEPMKNGEGYMESDNAVVTWCVGHLVTMSYPEAYDASLKKWTLEALPFIPESFKYEIIASAKKQYAAVKKQLLRNDVDRIYVCTDSGREGEYIYRLVEQMTGVKGKKRLRVWIDSQTEEEIRRGISSAKDLSSYDDLAASAYLRAKEDYLMGINFSRLLTLKYGNMLSSFLKEKRSVISVGRVMTCVQGMVVRREREIRSFVKTPFFRVFLLASPEGEEGCVRAEWRVTPGSRYAGSPKLYRDNGFLKREDAEKFIEELTQNPPVWAKVEKLSSKQEKVNPPLLYNLAELQNTCSKLLKISPDETLKIVQELYEKKLVTYPRTDARVLSTAIAKEIHKNIQGLTKIGDVSAFARHILDEKLYQGIGKSRYTNDKMITDHYAIIPTGQGLPALSHLNETARKVYELIVRRFLSIFYPPAVFRKYSLELTVENEHFFASYKTLEEPGFMEITGVYSSRKKDEGDEEEQDGADMKELFSRLRKGSKLALQSMEIKEGETTPPRRYTSGSMILAMENAGNLIEDEELRAQIKGSGIGTSATRAEILKKLVTNQYLKLNKKTQVISPTLLGEMIYDTVYCSIRSLLNPELTANWELGLGKVAEGELSEREYWEKMTEFIRRRTAAVLDTEPNAYLRQAFERTAEFYR